MYLLGNTETYNSVPMWQKVLELLRATDSVGSSLELCCPRHPDIAIQVSQPDDFIRLSPEGGCRLACHRRLDCGHKCSARCHSESMHKIFTCPQPCERLHKPCQHPCQKNTCGEDCGQCQVRINNVQLACGHAKDGVACFRTRNIGTIQCNVLVEKAVIDCRHVVSVPCWQDVDSETFKCPTPCGKCLPCGHLCPGTCSLCNSKDGNGQPMVEHQQCKKICGRRYGTCNHTCPDFCHDGSDCGLCFAPCEVSRVNFFQELYSYYLPWHYLPW
jgi:hypothetical protein